MDSIETTSPHDHAHAKIRRGSSLSTVSTESKSTVVYDTEAEQHISNPADYLDSEPDPLFFIKKAKLPANFLPCQSPVCLELPIFQPS
jgi:hypothetical protein